MVKVISAPVLPYEKCESLNKFLAILNIDVDTHGMTRIHSPIFKCNVENTQGAFLWYLVFACLRQIVVIFAPLYLGSIKLLHRAFNFNLRTIKDGCGAANLQADFLHVRIVLNVFRFAYGYRWIVVFRGASFWVANLTVRWFQSRAHWIESTDFMILCHGLLAQHSSILIPGTARFRATRPLANLPTSWAIENVTILTVWRGWMWAHAVRHNHCVLTTSRHFMNAINFSGFNSDTAWFSARAIIWIVPSGRARNIVASSNSVFRLCLGRTQIRRYNFSCIIANTIDYELFNTAQAWSTAACVAFVAPWIGFSGNGSLNFYLIIIESVSVGRSVWIIVTAICVRTWLHETSFIVVGWLERVTLAVVNGSNNLREFQEDFTFKLSNANAFATCHATWAPITCNKPVTIQFTTLDSS